MRLYGPTASLRDEVRHSKRDISSSVYTADTVALFFMFAIRDVLLLHTRPMFVYIRVKVSCRGESM